MSDLITKLEAERDHQLEWAAWHKARHNTESAATHRGTAAGLTRAINIVKAETPAPPAFSEGPA
ncbi:MAG: hypothetical protein ABIS50_15350 [Luteolibacter sp.]|uniref:hypothetical protein n=1 Tax=Luteolibacter sp. TaxID=1962973 RepID=UPI003265FCE0